MISLNQIRSSIVLVRVNYDIPDRDHLARVSDSSKTIETLLNQGNKVVLLSHFGRPKGEDFKFSFKNLILAISERLGHELTFVDQFSNSFVYARDFIVSSNSQLFLLENTRFAPDEKAKDPINRLNLAKKYAEIGNYFVDEAFAVSHRQEATNTELASLLPSCKGISYQNEIDNLQSLKSNPQKPFVVIMAGSKLETKLPVVEKILPLADQVLLAGKLCFTFIQAAKNLGIEKYKHVDFGNSEIETGFIKIAEQLLEKYPSKIYLPTDFVYGNSLFEPTSIQSPVKFAFDIGQQTVDEYAKILSKAKTVFWNGTLGFYERKPFDEASLKIGYFLQKLQAKVVIGGGDTVSALPKEVNRSYDFVSMGGGATLHYLTQD